MGDEQLKPFERVEGPHDLPQDLMVEHQREDTEPANHGEPHHGDGAEIHTDAAGTDFLEPEDADENQDCGGRDEIFKKASGEGPVQAFIGFLDAFQRRYDRDGRGDDTVPVEQGGPEDTEEDEETPVFPLGLLLILGGGEGDQGHDAPFAVLVGFHDQENIFHHDHEDERPDDQGENRDDLRSPQDVRIGVLDP